MFTKASESFPAFVINLDKRVDRWQSVEPVLKPHFAVERFSAVCLNKSQCEALVPKLLDKDAFDTIGLPVRKRHEDLGSAGAVGCYLSHIAVWRKILDSGAPFGFVFEDDVIWLSPNMFPWLTEALQTDFDLLLLNYVARAPLKSLGGPRATKQVVSGTAEIKQLDRFFLTSAYVISSSAAKRLLDQCFPIREQIDAFLSRPELGLKIYVPAKPLVELADFGSDIGHTQVQSKLGKPTNWIIVAALIVLFLTSVGLVVLTIRHRLKKNTS